MFWTILTFSLLVVVYFVGKKFRKNLTGEIIIALFIGLFWEIVTGRMWVYDIKKLIVFNIIGNEIPVAVVFAWGVVLSASTLFSWLLQKNIFKKMNDITYFIGGLISIILICITSELIGYNTGLWEYYFGGILIPILNLPVYVLGAWFFFGTVFLATIKVYEDEIEKRIH